MRQSDGSEILGPNDPRNLVIGIITVSPNDDRQSVINALASQDKQGRDQIVLVLPAQNKSFKSAVDFAGLHQLSSELEATIVLVAPEKSKIENFARRESFTVYPTLEELVQEEFPPLEPESPAAATVEPSPDEEMDHTMMFPLEIPSPPAPAQAASQTPPVAAPQVPVPEPDSPGSDLVEDEEPTHPALAVPVLPTPPIATPPVATPPVPLQEDEVEDEEQTNPSLAVPVLPNPPGSPGPIFSPVPRSNLPAVVPPNTGALVPVNQQLPVYYDPIEPPGHRRSWRGLIITVVTILILLGLAVLFYRPVLDLFFPPTAIVTIVPGSQRVQRTYQLTAVLGLPDPTKNQVDGRELYATSQTQSQTVKATGQGHTDGQPARGGLTFYNTSSNQQTITAGTVVLDVNGLAVVSDQTVMLPALDTATGLSGILVDAHTVNEGTAQNIPAYDFNSQLCCGGTVLATNKQPFTGGQDAQNFTYVLQSDISGVVQSLNATLARQATMALQGQLHQNERPAGAPSCTPQFTSDHQAGDHASTVAVSVTTSCVSEVYDLQAVQVLATRNLNQDIASSLGQSYAPVGNTVVQVVRSVPDAHGNVQLTTNAAGIWAYQFTPAQRAHLASLIAGKSAQEARSILLGQTGVQDATITLTGVGVTSVPTDQKRITINVNEVQGLRA